MDRGILSLLVFSLSQFSVTLPSSPYFYFSYASAHLLFPARL
jgi:hypothetical protein